MSSIISVEQIANIALDRNGFPESIANIYEGTRQARAALRCYGQTRDALLRSEDWGFPRRDLPLTLLKAAPAGGYNPGVPWLQDANPPIPYTYEYAYPSDCLMLRSLRSLTPFAAQFMPEFSPRPVVFEIANDMAGQTPLTSDSGVPLTSDSGVPLYSDSVAQRVILCYIPSAYATYCVRVTDPSQWDVGFTEALIDGMTARLAPLLAQIKQGAMEAEKVDLAVAPAAVQQALSRVG